MRRAGSGRHDHVGADRDENWPGLVLGGLGPLITAGLLVGVRGQVAAATTALVLVLAGGGVMAFRRRSTASERE